MKEFILNLLEKSLVIPAKTVLGYFEPKIIAITGSVAKSSTKEAISQVLTNGFGSGVEKSHGTLNTKFGLPLSILLFKNPPKINFLWGFFVFFAYLKMIYFILSKKYPKYLILEIAADLPGDIERICKWLKVDIAVYTKIVPAHLEFFKTTKGIFNEKKQLAKSLGQEGVLILNKKDPWSSNIAKETKAKVFYYDNSEIDLSKQAAVRVGELMGLEKKLIDKSLEKLKPLEGRLNNIKIKNITIIDDSYNANPGSVDLALNYLKTISGKRKIVILGSMAELGDYSEKAHGIISKKAKESSDLLFLIGENYYEYRKNANNWFLDSLEFIEKNNIQYKAGDVILIKGSRLMKMEKIIQYLKHKLKGE